MALINRDKDASEQREVLTTSLVGIGTGLTLTLNAIPYPCTVQNVLVTAVGLSGAPTIAAWSTLRFIPGTGATTGTGIAGAYTITAFGTSGLVAGSSLFGAPGSMGISMQASGSSLLNLTTGDVVAIQTGGANAACNALTIQLVVKKTQDILGVYNTNS